MLFNSNTGLTYMAVAKMLLLSVFVGSAALAQTANTTPVTNRQTGEQVALVRAYWNANVDIANRTIACDHFVFNEQTLSYEETTSAIGSPQQFFLEPAGAFTHSPLPGGTVTGTAATYRRANWAVDDGVYSGIAPLEHSEFIEPVI